MASEPQRPILIAGGGIAGLTMALTCHQLRLPVHVFESTAELKPLGVGINLQPNAVRELIDLGLGDALPTIGMATKEYGFFTKFGDEIWTEPRGLDAGYAWPQYSLHRGELQMLLYRTLRERLASSTDDAGSASSISTGRRARGFTNHEDRVELHLDDGETVEGALLIGADGLHSAIRAQMVPDEGPPIWGGPIMWRGATLAQPFRGGASMVLCGHARQKFVSYPLTAPDDSGRALTNWIAELWFDPSASDDQHRGDWNLRVEADKFLPAFESWRFDWLNVPELIRATDTIYEYPMVDRNPLDRWTVGRTSLIGDAAHVMYPVGSNGASQAIVDSRVLGRSLRDHGVTIDALHAYEAELLPATTAMVLRNRSAGPDHVLQIVEERSGGVFDDINDVMPYEERASFAANYKGVAGFSIAELNASPPLLGSVA